ncbi:MAG TPA: hypothetical protein VLL48_09335 [Longimicrobiales bacterium]|nr:hypothetical protein [Longimicrobiales bacterium]
MTGGPAGGDRRPGERERSDEGAPEESGPVGPFPSWRWLYGAVLAWFVVVVLGLWVLTVALDFGAP